jgi:hypothetical protein
MVDNGKTLTLSSKNCCKKLWLFFFFFFFFEDLLLEMRRVKTFDETSLSAPANVGARVPLRRSIGDIKVTKSFFGWYGIGAVLFGAFWGLVFFLDRSSVVAKGLSVVPPLWTFIFLVYKRAHLGVSPVVWLGIALLFHGAGDVVIKLLGVVESMPLCKKNKNKKKRNA